MGTLSAERAVHLRRFRSVIMVVLAMSALLSGCSSSKQALVSGGGPPSTSEPTTTTEPTTDTSPPSEHNRTPLELLADSPAFEVHQVTENILPTPLAPLALRLQLIPFNDTSEGLPTVEYRFDCQDDDFAQIVFFVPAPDQRFFHWNDYPDVWRPTGFDSFGTDFDVPELPGQPAHRYAFASVATPVGGTGALVGSQIDLADETAVSVLVTAQNAFQDRTPLETSVLLETAPYNAPLLCTQDAWAAVVAHLQTS